MSEKQKILHIAEAMGGGVFTYLVELTNSLCQEYDITIAFGVRSETPENYKDYFDERINLIRIKNFRRSVNPAKDLLATGELNKIIKELKPDIIHLHSSKAGAIGRMFFSGKAKKMFYTPHGYSFLMKDISSIKKILYKTIEKICGNKNCMTVACGKGEWEQSIGASKKSTYISNGINMNTIDTALRENKFEAKSDFTVYTIGRIEYQKNPELFNEIAVLLPDIHFEWIGDGYLRDKLTSENINITGWTPSAKALGMARENHVFILPSRWEGLSISLLEAMYMKKPCIVSDVVGNRDVVTDGVNGYVCSTAEEFAKKIEEIMKDTGYYKSNGDKPGSTESDKPKSAETKIVENAYEEVKWHYNSGWLCSRYKELYNEE